MAVCESLLLSPSLWAGLHGLHGWQELHALKEYIYGVICRSILSSSCSPTETYGFHVSPIPQFHPQSTGNFGEFVPGNELPNGLRPLSWRCFRSFAPCRFSCLDTIWWRRSVGRQTCKRPMCGDSFVMGCRYVLCNQDCNC